MAISQTVASAGDIDENGATVFAVEPLIEQLTQGDEPAILVVDFAQFSEDQTVANALARSAPRRSVYLADPVAAPRGTSTVPRLGWLANEYAADLKRRQVAPTLVVGYCSAAALSLLLVAELRRFGIEPACALVEPTWVTDADVSQEVSRVRATLGAIGPTPEMSYAAVSRTLRGDLLRKLRAEGMPEEEVEFCATLLLERYEAWFGFMLATRNLQTPTVDFPVTVIVGSNSAASPPPATSPHLPNVVRLPVDVDMVPASDAAIESLLGLTLIDSADGNTQ